MIKLVTMSTQKTIESIIKKLKQGEIVFPTDFRGAGSAASIKMALSRSVKEGKLKRLAHGIYWKPKTDPRLGLLQPPLEDIATAIAEREHVRIQPAGSYALHKLGLSNQVPMKLVYLTDGTPRNIRIGKGGIKFKATTPKRLSMKGKISKLVIQALEELDTTTATVELKQRIADLIAKEDPKTLEADLKLTSAKINDFIVALTKQNSNDRMATRTR